MNTIFDYFKDKPITSIYDLCNEFTLYNLIISIEPNLKKVELIHGSDYKIKHDNFTKIIESLSNYLLYSPERVYFTSNADFSTSLKIDGIIKCRKNQAILLGEMILFLSSISKKRDSFEKLDKCTTSSLSLYIAIQEKYTTKYNNEDINKSIDDNENELDEINNNNDKDNIQNILLCEKLKKEIQDKNKVILQLQSDYDELENKYNSCNQELSHLKEMNDNEYLAKEDLINQQILNNSLNNEIKELKLTIENIKNEYELKIKTLNYKINISNEKIIALEQDNIRFKDYATENERLKEKIKTLNSYKDTDKRLLESEKIINGKNELIQDLTKEKNKIQDKNILLMKELSELKKEINNKENKNISVENELRKVKNEYQELKQSEKNLNKLIEDKKENKGFELKSLLESGEIDLEEDDTNYKQKYLEAIEEMETYKNIITPLTEEKEKLENENKNQKEIIKKLGGSEILKKLSINEEDKEINALKQKISEQNNISEELRKILDNKDKESDEYKKNLTEIMEQLEIYKNAVTLLTEEKGEYMDECQKLKDNIKKLENELSKNNSNVSSDNINNNNNNVNNNNNNNDNDNIKEINDLKEKLSERDGLIETLQGIISGDKDINILKNDGIDYKEKYNKLNEEKNELEKKYNEIKINKDLNENKNKLNEEKIKKLEEEINDYKNNNLKLSNNNNKLVKEINELKNKIMNDKDNKVFQKKIEELNIENENIKNNSIKEHELIASSMLELAKDFFSLKKEISNINNMKSNDTNLSWVEIERKKNFPCEYYN